MITTYGQRTTSGGNAVTIIYSDILTNEYYLGSSYTNDVVATSMIIAVKSKLYIKICNKPYATNEVSAVAYRRIGTNA